MLWPVLAAALLASLSLATPENPHLFEADELPQLITGGLNLRLLPSVGNGHVATNVFSSTIYVNGVFTGRLGESHRARVQSMHASEFGVEGCDAPGRLYRLDTRRALMEEIVTCPQATVTYRTYAHASIDRVLVTEVHVERAPGSANLVTVTRSDLSGSESNEFVWEAVQQVDMFTFYKTGTTTVAETDDSSTRTVHIYFNSLIPSEFVLQEGQDSHSQLFLFSIDTDRTRAFEDFERALVLSFDTTGDSLRFDHVYNWELTWDYGDIILEGDNVDTFLHETVKGALYYLYSNLPSITSTAIRVDDFFGLSPGGLPNGAQGSDYYGHVFWDMETWMYPAIAMYRPDLAKAMLKYRIQGIDEARMRAQEGGYEGARFPWESAYTGAEVTPDICIPCRENQLHITGDISFAARTLVSLTRDLTWLGQVQPGNEATGNEFIVEMAHFFESRLTFDEVTGKWEINGVMPPDEHQQSINNSIYTNLLANMAVSTARWTTCLLAGEAEAALTVPEEWLEKVKNLVFTYNTEKRYHEEYEGFDDQYSSGNLDERGIKQADVVLLPYPLLWDMPDDVRRNDLEIYEPITNLEGPAMTWSIFAISWMELGEEAKSESLFARSYQDYVREPFKIWTEVQSGVGAVNFITGAGGFLQAMVFGYGGIRIYPYHLAFKSNFMPPTVDRLKLVGLQYLGTKFDLELTPGEVALRCGGPMSAVHPLAIEFDDGTIVDFVCGPLASYPRQNFQMYSKTVEACPPPRDEIIVDYS